MHDSRNILIVGFSSWPKHEGYCCYCVKSPYELDLILENGHLSLVTQGQCIPLYGVIWQPAFQQVSRRIRHLLNMIRFSSARCLNPASSFLMYEDRLDSLFRLREAGLPVLPQDIVSGEMALLNYRVSTPTVMKIGNHHGGFGKARISDLQQIEDCLDLAAASHDYVAFEPFVNYRQDIRVTVVGDKQFSMERVPSSWKANASPKEIRIIEAPTEPKLMAFQAAKALECALVGCDFLLTEDNQWILLEANMICGLDGFDVDIKSMLIPLLESMSDR